jgi:hypothetical protein
VLMEPLPKEEKKTTLIQSIRDTLNKDIF